MEANRQLQALLTLGAVGQKDDAELLARFVAAGRGRTRSGKLDAAELAFEAIVDRHGATVLRVARGILGDEASSLDAFQATFLILARKAPSLRVAHSLAPWLASVARRVALGLRKAQVRRTRHERAASRPEATNVSPSGYHAWTETTRAIVAEVDRLPEPFRSAIVACHLDGLTQQAAADRLGWPVGTLQSRLDRGRQKLRARLTRRGLAPTALGLLPPSGLSVTLPATLAPTTARTATLWAIRSASSPSIAPSVLAILQTSKGTAMTKLAALALTLTTAVGLAVTGTTLGFGFVPQQPGDNSPTDQAVPGPVKTTIAAGQANEGLGAETPTDLDPLGTPTSLETTKEAEDRLPPPAEGPGLPTLLCFLDYEHDRNFPVLGLDRLAAKGYPIRGLDVKKAGDLKDQYKVETVPAFILINGSGQEVARTTGRLPIQELADFYNQNRSKASTISVPKSISPIDSVTTNLDAPEPPLTISPAVPRPWETAVRIRIHLSGNEKSFGSGTIISSNSKETIVLTCAHNLRSIQGDIWIDAPTSAPISIDRFGGELNNSEGKLPCIERDLPSEIYHVDFKQNLALLRFYPGKVLPASPIAPSDWTGQKGMKLFTTGCSHGNDVTAWDTTIVDPKVLMNGLERTRQVVMKCTNQPAPGRSGGGLFTTDGYLVGVCNYADPNEHVGLYAAPQAVLDFLRNTRKPLQYTSIASQSFLQSSQTLSPGRVLATNNSSPEDTKQRGSERELNPQPSESSQEQRLNDLEQKLDRVLRSLENIRGELTPFRTQGGLGP